MKKRLTKSLYDKRICGICGGAAEYFDTDSTIIRVIFVIFAFLYYTRSITLPRFGMRNSQQTRLAIERNSDSSSHPQKGKRISLCTR